MALDCLNPDGLTVPENYSHVVVVTARRLVFISGQVAEDATGNLVGADDFRSQARQAFANVGRALVGAGARPDQVARLTIYVVDYQDDFLHAIRDARTSVFGEHKPADALIGVAALAHRGCLIEVEAIAALED